MSNSLYYIYVSINISKYFYLSNYLHFLYVYLSIFLSMYISIYLSIYLSSVYSLELMKRIIRTCNCCKILFYTDKVNFLHLSINSKERKDTKKSFFCWLNDLKWNTKGLQNNFKALKKDFLGFFLLHELQTGPRPRLST